MTKRDLTKPVKDFVSDVQTVIYHDQTIEEALAAVRGKDVTEKIIYFYVLDEKDKLLGVVSTRKLLLNDPKQKISEVMEKSVISLQGSQSLREAMEFLESHHLLALPVVDEERHFLGVIDVQLYFDEQVDIAYSKRRGEIFQMIGYYIEDGRKLTPIKSYRYRMPWIFCNMIGGFACAAISKYFDAVLSHVIVLAMFIPLLLTLSESISMQSLTQSMQVLRRGKTSMTVIARTIWDEWKVLGILASSCGVIVGLISLLWGGGVVSGLVIMLGIGISVFISASIGAVVPLLLHKRKWDPKVASGPVVLMFADVLTTAIYLSLDTWWLL